MKIDDEKRIKIMDALWGDGCLEPNYTKISDITGYDIKTVKNSLFFLEKEKAIKKYVPFLDAKKMGFNDLGLTIMNLQFKNEEEKRKIDEKIMETLPNYYIVFDTNQPGLMNRITMSIFRDSIERYNKLKEINEKLGSNKFIKDRITSPLLEKIKYASLSRTVIDILLQEKGIKSIFSQRKEEQLQ